ncbi:ABC transporter ATP-binding protein [Roseateles asaccharophilus]|uniref:ABC transport system ATP-binding protein n=1 Tax=Roseateles asaccharophilus TaxID=582607 RepID=A0ABU2A4V8_9BURK|nr:ABC transporter ATP-binding protein [Roseateles asaccharophilus]MDR7332239.1 putative ABC transport system ATP-binding protein [Roseateles asaccharophilus]
MFPNVENAPSSLLRARGLTKSYGDVPVFAGIDVDLAPGEIVALLGESGSGKSTLLNCLAGLDEADAGSIVLAGQDLRAMDDEARSALRREALGFVFQAFHLLPHLSVADNVALPLRLLGLRDDGRVAAMLEAVDLAALAARMPRQLSGGQLQRVAIARALVHRPRLVLADEPTGNLDARHAAEVLELLRRCTHEAGAACLLVTHSDVAAQAADRRLRMDADGLHAA